MSDYVGREHIEGILEQAGMQEQALIAAGEKHIADSRSMILLAREIRLLRRSPSAEVARAKFCYDCNGVAELNIKLREIIDRLAKTVCAEAGCDEGTHTLACMDIQDVAREKDVFRSSVVDMFMAKERVVEAASFYAEEICEDCECVNHVALKNLHKALSELSALEQKADADGKGEL